MDLSNVNHGYLSYSGMTTWNDCPYKFYLHYIAKQRVRSDNIYNHFGGVMHEIMEQLFDPNMKKTDFIKAALPLWKEKYFEGWEDSFIDPKFYLKEEDKIIFYEQGINTIKNKLTKIHAALKRRYGDYTIVGKELSCETPIFNGTNITGNMDLVIDSPKKGAHIIIDYKAVKDFSKWRNVKPIKFHQANIYDELYRVQHGCEKVETAFLIISRAKDNEIIQFVDNPLEKSATYEWVDIVTFGIKNDVFFKNKGGSSCYMCQYNRTEYCP